MSDLAARVLDGTGAGLLIDAETLRRWTPGHGPLWVAMRRDSVDGRRWLAEDSGLAAGDQETLLRPVRQTRAGIVENSGLTIALRVFADETGALRQVRCFARVDRLITVSDGPMPAFEALVSLLDRGRGPRTIADVLVSAIRVAGERDQVAAYRLDEDVVALELAAERDLSRALEPLRQMAQRATALRRRLGAQREALALLKHHGPAWLLDEQPDQWRDVLAGNSDLVGTLDAVVDRIRSLQDFAQNQLSSALNDRLYLLTVLSAIVMPLSFVTGLLGVNLRGIPARDQPWAFAALCLVLVLIAAGEYLLLRRLRWVPGANRAVALAHPGAGLGVVGGSRNPRRGAAGPCRPEPALPSSVGDGQAGARAR